MDKRRFLHAVFLPLLLLVAVDAAAQHEDETPDSSESDMPMITAIFVHGNEHTKSHVILREMKSKTGERVDPETIEGDQKRILNMGLFNYVQIEGIPDENGLQLHVIVDETWYLYPFPIFFLNDRDWSKLSYGAGLLHFNFRGRRELISASGWLGYNPALKLDYSNPWLLGDANLFARAGFFTKRVRNQLLEEDGQEIDDRRIGGSFTLGKRFGHHTFLSSNFSYTRLKFDSAAPINTANLRHPLTLNPPEQDSLVAQDLLPSVGLSFLYDTRDLHEYPRAGNYASIWVRRTGIDQEFVHYLRYGADLRHYQPLTGGLSLALRAMTNLSDDVIPSYDLVYFGFQNRIRGHFHRVISGENLAMASVELRIPIVPITYAPLADFPLFGETLVKMFGHLARHYKYGVSAALFVDYGNSWNQDEPFATDRGLMGYGVGLHLHVPVLNVLRFEYALNEDQDSQFFVDYGVSF